MQGEKLATTHPLSSCQRSAEGGRVSAEKAMSSPNSLRPTQAPTSLSLFFGSGTSVFPGRRAGAVAAIVLLHAAVAAVVCMCSHTLRRFIVLRLHLYSRNGEEYSEQELRTELIHRSLLSIQKDERECDGCVDFRGNFGFGGERASTAPPASAPLQKAAKTASLSPQDCVSP